MDANLHLGRYTTLCWCGTGKLYRDCCADKKPRTLRLQVDVSQTPRNAMEFLDHAGEMKLLNEGRAVTPGPSTLEVHYEKSRGRLKPTLRIPNLHGRLCTTIASAINAYDFFLAVDTNTRKVGSEKISITCALLNSVNKSTHQLTGIAGWLMEHRDVTIAPEKLGWGAALYVLGRSVLYGVPGWGPGMNVGMVVDHDRDALDAINARSQPFFSDQLLPDWLTMIYATTDQSDSALNELLRFADRKASLLMQHIIAHPHEQWDPFANDQTLYRCRRFWTDQEAEQIMRLQAETRRASKAGKGAA